MMPGEVYTSGFIGGSMLIVSISGDLVDYLAYYNETCLLSASIRIDLCPPPGWTLSRKGI